METKLVKHVRVPIHRFDKRTLTLTTEWRPIATIVALSPEQIGVAVCSKHDNFSKKRGTQIATDRAILGKSDFECSPREKYSFIVDGEAVEIKYLDEIIYDSYLQMLDRAQRYFSPPVQQPKPKAKRSFVKSLIRPWSNK